MHNRQQFQNLLFRTICGAAATALAIIFVLALILIFAQRAEAQTFQVLYNFTGGADGASPYAGLTMDAAGNLYGTTLDGGYYGGDECRYAGCGVVFKLTRTSSGWQFLTIHTFQGAPDGAAPLGGVTIGPDGSLYGTTAGGGSRPPCGTVYKLRQPLNATGPWTETILYTFSPSGGDGCGPQADVIFDQVGNIYGTTNGGGEGDCGNNAGCGAVFMLTPSNGTWAESVLHRFTEADGGNPMSGLTIDRAGNLYGTTDWGGWATVSGWGVVYELTPSASAWTETVLRYFRYGGIDGFAPIGGLFLDGFGHLYGVNNQGGPYSSGTAFMLSPSDDQWIFDVIYPFNLHGEGGNPAAALVMDAAGNLYGTGRSGLVFKLTQSGGIWTETTLHEFTGGAPWGGVVLDGKGNLFGTTTLGGTYGYGIVWEITQ